jgi:hypothetical protein
VEGNPTQSRSGSNDTVNHPSRATSSSGWALSHVSWQQTLVPSRDWRPVQPERSLRAAGIEISDEDHVGSSQPPVARRTGRL